ncbi:MobV family relaxase [Vibrio aestuarianus]|uniref:MobV family relaxase n=1 Tax=Vibrio aestuarianus TaxID=28171 RepID=UPI001D7B2CC4|nr:MobV family relaxase [Vibrio aestuarianus]EGR2264784.1 hypothetical protein [Vibrio parahaemolyticus]EHR6685985.1 plasmid recombination protein [Vibrio parahaemolyticus]EHR6714579.1 plasmid recombination protein [Vibrio parahaemolyticus]MDE1211473.1 plasmid recombination protein [Vibrio aestuarianus]
MNKQLKTILRFEKIKTFKDLRLSCDHVYRRIETPNANPEIKNFHIFGSKNIAKSVRERLKKKGIKIRKNSVLCMEAILELSPEYYENDIDKKKLTDFTKAGVKFLQENFGDNVINVVLHLDEKTPHLHAHIIPISDDGRLSARDLFNKITLKSFQKKYCQLMSKEINYQFTYEEGSKAKHTDVKKYYAMINDELKKNERLIENVVKLENKLMDEQDNNFALTNKVKKLENQIKLQQEEINGLNKLVKKLKKFLIKLKRVKKEPTDIPYELPELTIYNHPDKPKELNKKKRRNRP